MSTLPDIATMIPIKLAVIGSSGSESAMVKARLRAGLGHRGRTNPFEQGKEDPKGGHQKFSISQ